MFGIRDREGELALETGVAHAMATTKLCRSARGQIIVHADDAFHPVPLAGGCSLRTLKRT